MAFSLTLSPEAIPLRQSLRQQILRLSTNPPDHKAFGSLALAIFRYQAAYNPVYRHYLNCLDRSPQAVTDLRSIPFMPIDFFKRHTILTGSLHQPDGTATLTFASSGTTDSEQTSRHLVPDAALYDAISSQIFEQAYGSLRDFHILALLPSYLERNNSSLVYMVQRFMSQSGGSQHGSSQRGSSRSDGSQSGFFLNNHQELTERLQQLSQQPDQKKILLIGVTFGLLDWAESAPELTFLGKLPNLVVMETGGMKGRRQELLREEVHDQLRARLGIHTIHSEYGMTELLSQAYSAGNGVFRPSATLRVFLRDINDPFLLYPADYTRSGGINVVDLANLDSCSFIETKDLGQYVGTAGDFGVIGRFDNSDIRGCNLLVVS